MLVCGQPPFQEANESETLTMIMDCKYDIPPHISENCRRNPDKRATLAEITKDPWLSDGKKEHSDMFPLVSKEQLSEEDHNLIIQKIVNGNIATKEEVLDCLEKNEYNHITSTYYLLAERKLRSKTMDHTNKLKRPEQLSVSQSTQLQEKSNTSAAKPCLLSVPRTPGDLPQRSRKCSIVQEDEEEEDISPCSRQEDLGPPLNRRGSRSEGRLNLALQERIAESERRKPTENIKRAKNIYLEKNIKSDLKNGYTATNSTDEVTKCDTIKIPVISNQSSCSYIQLNEIFEDAELLHISEVPSRKFVHRNQPYEQRKIKFHKSRTASCSSSDASDDDSENRKKHAQKLNSSSKSYQSRRDSHDDSSDSQEPGTGAGPSNNTKFNTNTVSFHSNKNRDKKYLKKRNGKTRLRESQSLNRITEVQEDGSQSVVISATIFSIQGTLPPKVKSIGAKILKGFHKTVKQSSNDKYGYDESMVPISKKNSGKVLNNNEMIKNSFETQESHKKMEKCCFKKSRILGKYFHVHKKICIPLPALFSKRRIYKAQSCSSLTKKKIFLNSETLPYMSHNDDNISQNGNNYIGRSSPNIIDLNSVCNELTEICSIKIGMKAM
ncbi:hypothetical protein NQ314_003976 [Rhamnusium bicolor]|uniref:Uncharacterized protein n=1 Tax=Rhamnusium bicolor TaxID=1586634 RepID=A0AAV8ZNX4_9CUCU|nr:hypothetical protein NQ314_003976 [Rhamnusium bicolor]